MKRIILACIISFLLGALLPRMWRLGPRQKPQPRIDTVAVSMPEPVDSFPVRVATAKLAVVRNRSDGIGIPDAPPEHAGIDSVEAEVPIISKEYADSNYQAWVSGYMPSLDSIHIYQRPPPLSRPKRWHLGVSAGMAATSQGLSPYVGIGITYSFISF